MIIESPTAASAAATVITKNTRICPVAFPIYCENAMSERLTELSISSTHINTTIAFRCVRTPTTPVVKSIALRMR